MKILYKSFKEHKIKYLYIVLSLLGIALSAYLWYLSASYNPNIPCTAFSDCASVLTGEYSKMFGTPVAAFGLFYYVIMLILSFQRLIIEHKLLDKMLFAGILWGIIFSVYLRYLEFVKIGHICVWCWMSVILIVLFIVLYLWEQKQMKS